MIEIRCSNIADSVDIYENSNSRKVKKVLKARWKYLILYAPLAQLVEHMTLNHQVAGSSPAGCTRKCENKLFSHFFIFMKSDGDHDILKK
jgi:hypothetical protein